MRKYAYGNSRNHGNSSPVQYRPAPVIFDLHSGSISNTVYADHYIPVYLAGSSNATGLSNSPRSVHFHQLTESISRLAALPKEDPMHIDGATRSYAIDLVGLLRGQLEIDAPLMFPQDAEALVLSWDQGLVKRLLTIAGEEVSLLDLNKATQSRCYHDVSDGQAAMADLIPLLAETASLRSTAVED